MSFTIIPSFEFSYISCISRKSLETSKLKFTRIYMIHVHITPTFTFPFITLGNSSHLVLQNHLRMWCLVIFNEIFSFTSQKGDSIAGADYLKLKNDVIHCNTIISDKSQIHAAPNFLLLSSWIASHSQKPATHYYTRLKGVKKRIA